MPVVRRLAPATALPIRMAGFAGIALGVAVPVGCSVTLDPIVYQGPDVTQPDVNEPDVNEPGVTEPGVTEPESPVFTPEDGDAGAAPVLQACTTFRSATHEYELCPQPLTWLAAENDCSLRGTALASVESAAENDLIVSFAVALGTNVWLSGTRDDDLVWRWATGEIFWRGDSTGATEGGAYAKWAPGEPNDDSTVSTDPERCLVLTLGASDWNDRVCSLELPYVCERPIEP